VPALRGFGKRTGQGDLCLQVLPEERARMRERAPSRLKLGVPEWPRMDHMRPNLEGRGDVGLTGGGGETDGVVAGT
jgi:hypothetical protein